MTDSKGDGETRSDGGKRYDKIGRHPLYNQGKQKREDMNTVVNNKF